MLKVAAERDDYAALGFSLSTVTSRDSWKAVTFTDDHDTARTDGDAGWPWIDTTTGSATDNILVGYAYILTHPSNTPMVFWSDWSDRKLQAPIKGLIVLRGAAGIDGGSTWFVDKHQRGLYTATVSGAKGKLLVKLGSAYLWSPLDSDYWGTVPKLSGKNWAVWWHKTTATSF